MTISSTLSRHKTPRKVAMAPMRRLAGRCLAALAMLLPLASFAPLAAQQNTTPAPITLADFNSDGIPDAIVPSLTGPTATIAFGTVPFGSFSGARGVTFPSACASFYTSITGFGPFSTADFNADGFPDLLFLCRAAGSDTNSVAGVMLGRGDGTFATPVLLPASFTTGLVLGDFNGDGKPDVALFGGSTTNSSAYGILLFTGKGDGTFNTPSFTAFGSSATFSPAFVIESAVAVDVNGDGKTDIVTESIFSPSGQPDGAPRTLAVFGNDGQGSFGIAAQGATRAPNTTAALGTNPGVNAYKLFSGNIFGGGRPDFLVPDIGTTPGLLTIRNNSTATAYALAAVVRTAYPGLLDVRAGSFSGSPFLDLAVANGSTIAVLTNDGTGAYTARYTALSVASTTAGIVDPFALADANGDGYSDLYTAASVGGSLQIQTNLVNGSATATSQPFTLGAGDKDIAAAWLGNTLFDKFTAASSQTVVLTPTTSALASSANPSTVGDPVTFTALVTPSAGTAAPTGTVTITDGGASIGGGAISGSGSFSLVTSDLTAGTHSLVASYSGDAFYAPSTSPILAQVVNRGAAVAPVLTWANPAPITFGTPLGAAQLNATAADPTGAAIPGIFTYTPAAGTILGAGSRTLNVLFTPTDTVTFANATASVTLLVQPGTAGTAFAITSGNTAVTTVGSGTVITLTATVTSGTNLVTTGQVSFCDAAAAACTDSHLLGIAQLTSTGTASLRFIPAPGVHSYRAVFAGTNNNTGSASSSRSLSVTAANPTTTTIAQAGSVGNYTLTATTVGTGVTAAPTGAVSFLDTTNAGAVLGTGTLGGASATLALRSAASSALPADPGAVAVADFNGDGKPDMAVSIQGAPGVPQSSVVILLGNGDGTFTTSPALQSGSVPFALAVADFNADGKTDLAVANQADNTVTILLGQGDGTFASAATLPVNVGALAIVSADFNGDGIADLAVAGSSGIKVLAGKGDGTFTDSGNVPFDSGVSYLVSGDFNADGKADLVAVNQGSATILLGAGDGTFTATSSGNTLNAAGSLGNAAVVADFNADGKQDLAVLGLSDTGRVGVTLFQGNGDGTFTSTPSLILPTGATGSKAYSIATGDFNGDGRPDLSVVDLNDLTILLNKGDGTFTTSTQIATATDSNVIPSAAADFNGDGISDIAVANSDLATVQVLLGLLTQTVTATATAISPQGAGLHQVVASFPGDAVYAASTSAPTALTGISVTPILTWNPAVSTLVFGTPLGPQQLNATAADPSGAALAGTFAYTPAAGTILPAGVQTLSVTFTPANTTFVPVTRTASITVTRATPTLVWQTPAAIAYGTPLSAAQLNAVVTGVTGAALPGTFTYTPAIGTVLLPGTQALAASFTPTDAANYTAATGSVSLIVTPPALAAISPATVNLGSGDTTLTLTGSGFVASSVVQVNGTAVATTLVNPTTLRALVPSANFLRVTTLPVLVATPVLNTVTAPLTLNVVASTPSIVVTGPPTTPPGSQPAVTITLTNPYPVPLTATLSLNFTGSATPATDDPAIQFASGGRIYSFVVPANSTTVPPIQLQSGTVAGTITILLRVAANGIDVTPFTLSPVVIVVPPAVPVLSTTTITRSGNQLTVAMHGFSNTREVSQATFHFLPAPGATITTPDVSAPIAPLFATWFTSAQSQQFGSSFTYTQIFTTSEDSATVGSVDVTLTNSVGVSITRTAQ